MLINCGGDAHRADQQFAPYQPEMEKLQVEKTSEDLPQRALLMKKILNHLGEGTGHELDSDPDLQLMLRNKRIIL